MKNEFIVYTSPKWMKNMIDKLYRCPVHNQTSFNSSYNKNSNKTKQAEPSNPDTTLHILFSFNTFLVPLIPPSPLYIRFS